MSQRKPQYSRQELVRVEALLRLKWSPQQISCVYLWRRAAHHKVICVALMRVFRGVWVAACSDGVLAEVVATCEPARDCVSSGADDGSTDDGGATRWRFTGRLADGAVGTARSDDGRTRPIECRAGVLGLRWAGPVLWFGATCARPRWCWPSVPP